MKFNPLSIKIKKEKLLHYFVKYKIFQNKKLPKINDKKNNPFIDKRPYGPDHSSQMTRFCLKNKPHIF